MIRPPGPAGVAFSEGGDGDARLDPATRSVISAGLGISEEWATVTQVHGAVSVEVGSAGPAGEADALWTTRRRLPLAVFTADCFGVVLSADGAVGVAHAGWRGVDAGVVARLRAEMAAAGHQPSRAAVGPGIGPCCFEVGPEVAERFPGGQGHTTWGTTSVDLAAALAPQLQGVEVWSSGACTRHEEGWFSHRRDGTTRRLASIGWLP